MIKKKNSKGFKINNVVKDHNTINKKVSTSQINQQILNQIQAKIASSSVLNGGFDTLLFKVDRIEESQVQLIGKVDSIHDAIYQPDNGIYARLKSVEQIKLDDIDQIEKDVYDLKSWKHNEEKTFERENIIVENNKNLIQLHNQQIKELITHKDRVTTIIKWIFVTISTGILTLVGKIIYDFITGHITFM